MDIPDSGAIFTLGKSNLSDDHQHFFFIKNDPIEKLKSGNFESAVICKSGRCFVWGYNNYGQLGIGQICDVVTKPSCIKEIKQQLLKVVDICFGDGFSVILTNDNRLFCCGKNILPDSFNCLPSAVEIISKPIPIDDLNNERKYGKIAAGSQRFAAFSKSRKELIICGKTPKSDKSKVKVLKLWDDVKELACGSTFTLALAKSGLLYAVGQIGEKVIPTLMRIDHPKMNFSSVHISHKDEIFLLTKDGEVYRNEVELHFHKYPLIPNLQEKIVAFASGKDGVLSFLTSNHRFFTSFPTPKAIESFYDYKEITKFKAMDVKQLASGHHHILVHALRNDQKAFYTRNIIPEYIYPPIQQNGNLVENKDYKNFEIQEYVNNIVNGNDQMTYWSKQNGITEVEELPIKGTHLYSSLGAARNNLDENDNRVVFKKSPSFVIPQINAQNSFDSSDSSQNDNKMVFLSDKKLNKVDTVLNDKYEKVRQELERDENLRIIKYTDPVRGEIYHSYHTLPNGDLEESFQTRSLMDIRFIDNGIDVTESIKKARGPFDEGSVLGEKLLHPKRFNKVGCVKEETMQEILESPCIQCRKKTPFHEMGVSFENDDFDEKTTATMNSPPPKTPPPGAFKQFLMDLKNIPQELSCKKDDTMESRMMNNNHEKQVVKKRPPSSESDQSVICTIL